MKRAGLLLLVVAGCGDDAGSGPDAPGDSAIDAEIGEAIVRVTVTDRGVPAIGATVYFQNPDSSVIRMSSTGLDGIARAPMPDSGFVTVIEPRAMAFGPVVIRDRLATFTGVKNGDDLHLDLRPSTTHTSISPLIQVPVDPAAESYELFSTCGRATLGEMVSTMPQSVQLTDCGGIADIVVVSTDVGSQPLRALYKAGQAVADGAVVTLTEPYTNLAPLTLTVTGSPAWVDHYVVQLELASPRGPLFSAFGNIDAAASMRTFALPATTGTTLRLRADFYGIVPAVSRQTIVGWELPVGDQAVDAGAAALRPFTSAPAFDPAARTVTWTDDAGRAPDVVRTEVYTYRDGDPAHAWSWQIVAPYDDRASVTYPVLPGADGAAFTTLPTDSHSISELETLAVGGGYDRIRAHALRTALDVVPAGGVGQLTYQRLADADLVAPPTVAPLASLRSLAPSRAPATFTRATR